MEAGLFGAISESVKLIGNLNSLSVIQDDIISSSNDNHLNGVAGEMGLIKVGGGAVSPMLPESSDLIYTDLSYNVSIKQEGNGGGGPIVPGGESSSSALSWGGGADFGGQGALNDLVNGSDLNASFGGSMSSAVITDGFGIEDLDSVSCPTPSLSDNDNFSFLSDCSEGDKFAVKTNDGENDYVQAWISSEPPNPFPLPSLATMPVLEYELPSDPISGGVELPLLDGAESDSFSTINTEDLDDLLGPSASTSPLKCADCRKTFDNPMTLQIHNRLHTGERPYKCKECGEGFIHYTYLDYHMNNTHGRKEPPKNNSINQRRNSQTSTNSKEGTTTAKDPGQPTAGMSNSGTKTKSKKLKNGLVENKRSPTGAGGPFPCPYCHKGFRHSSWLIMHLRTHTGERPYKCTHCDLAYTQRGNLMGHLKKQHNITNYEPTSTATTITATVKPEEPLLQPISTSTNLTVRRIQTKKKRHATPTSNYNTIESDSQNGAQTATNTNKGSRPVRCTICGVEFSQRQDLIIHMHCHGGASFSCSECGRMFRQSANLQKHKRDVHGSIDNPTPGRRQSTGTRKKKRPILPPEAAPYTDKYNLRPCAVQLKRCDLDLQGDKYPKEAEKKKSFSSKKKIGGRMQRKTARRPMAFPPSGPGYKCNICNKVLLTTTNLTVHMRIHTGEKPYQCSFCKKKFSVQSNLKAHERLHTGEKPYQCSLCSTAFTTRGNFTAHLRSHGVNPYKCSLCTDQFTFSWKLKKHMLVAHNKKMKAEHKRIFN